MSFVNIDYNSFSTSPPKINQLQVVEEDSEPDSFIDDGDLSEHSVKKHVLLMLKLVLGADTFRYASFKGKGKNKAKYISQDLDTEEHHEEKSVYDDEAALHPDEIMDIA
jgi:hypothetical protein